MAVFIFPLELVKSPVVLIVVPVLPPEPVEIVVPITEPVAPVAVARLPVELVESPIALLVVPILLLKLVEEVILIGVPGVLVTVFIFLLELVESPITLIVVPVLLPEPVEPVVPVIELAAPVAVARLPVELVLKLDVGSVTWFPLVGGGVMTGVTLLEITVAVPDVELEGAVVKEDAVGVTVVSVPNIELGGIEDEEIEFVLVVIIDCVGAGL